MQAMRNTHLPSTRVRALRARVAGLLALCLSLTAVGVVQAEPVVSASIYPLTVRPGGTATFTITVADGRPSNVDKPPQLPDGMELVSPTPNFGEVPVSVRGVEQMALTMSWGVTCPEAGIYIIPPQTVEIRGDAYRTKTTRLVVKDDPNASNEMDPILSIKAEKQEMYEGELVPLTATLYIHGHTMLRRPGLIELPKDNFAVQRFPLQPDEESVVRFGNVPYRANAFFSTVSGLKPGKFTLGPATCEIYVEVPMLGEPRSGFLANQSEFRKFKVKSSELSINVLPLPVQGRPANFTGAVGDFSLGLTADPLEVNVGDPIAVEMTVSGTGNFDAVEVPVLTDPKAWKLYPARKFQPSEGGFTPRTRNQRITFTQIILPSREVKEIPPFEFSFFNPAKKQFEVRRTQAVPIKVRNAGGSTPEAPASTPAASSKEPEMPSAVPTVKPALTDILTETPARAAWFASTLPLGQDRSFWFANAIAGGALLLIIAIKLAVVAARSRALSPEAPARKLWRTLRGPHPRAEFYTLALQYAGMKGLSPEAVHEIQQRQEELNYSRHPADAAQPVSAGERNHVLRILQGRPGPEAAPASSSPPPPPAAPEPPSPQPVTMASSLNPQTQPGQKEEEKP